MTAEAFAMLVPARSAGRGRWVGRCPAHPDRSPSLSITGGRDGRVLLRCFAGCESASVLKAMGLSWSDVFNGPALSAAHLARARRLREVESDSRRQRRVAERAIEDRSRALDLVIRELAARLALQPEDEAVAELLERALWLMPERLLSRTDLVHATELSETQLSSSEMDVEASR
jgi:hypothetical protein